MDREGQSEGVRVASLNEDLAEQSAQLDRSRILVSRGTTSLQRPRQVSWSFRIMSPQPALGGGRKSFFERQTKPAPLLPPAHALPSHAWTTFWMNHGANMGRHNKITLAIVSISLIALSGCDDLVPQDTTSLFVPRLQRSEIVGLLAGFGTTFAAVPDFVSMLRRRSSAGMNPRMAAIMDVFQVL